MSEKLPKVKRKFKNSKVGKFLIKFGTGLLTEVVSIFVPKGHKIASRIEDKVLGNIEEKENTKSKVITMGNVLMFVIVVLFLLGKLNPEKTQWVLSLIESYF